jgi:thiamine-phosphate pyrophosphorylase
MSTHSRAEVVAAGTEPIDYFAVGPVHETPTKPGRPAVGLELVRFSAEVAEHPWFAIGGITEATLPAAIEAGARRVVVVRAITESRDPPAAARRLRDLLDSAALD